MRIQRSPFKPRAKGGYKIENKTDKEATIYIYDEIGWFGVEASIFVKDLSAITANTIHVRINSPGGNVFDGTAIFNAIKQHESKTITHIDGLAASISSVIALASDEVRMAENAFLMIHDPWSIVIGTATAMREEADLLDKVSGPIVKTYMDKTGMNKAQIRALMSPPEPDKIETWMSADEALEMGFIDVIEEDEKDEKAKATLFDLSVFANVPDQLKGKQEIDVNERDLERALRDAGCSRNLAKEILAKGFKGDLNEREAQKEARLQAERETQAAEETRLREAEEAEKGNKLEKKKDRTAELLTKGEILALNKSLNLKEVLKDENRNTV